MTQLNKTVWLGVFAAVLLLLASRASAQTYVTPTVATTPPVQGQLIVVNNGPGNQTQPHVDGDLVCYTDDSTGNSIIHYFNLATQTGGVGPNNGTSSDFLCDVRGTTIVYTSDNGQARIFTFDTAVVGGQPVQIAPQPGLMRFGAQIGDAAIAWQEGSNSSLSLVSSIVAYERVIGNTTVLSQSLPALNWNPGVSADGNVVVWENCAAPLSACAIWKATRLGAGVWTSPQQVSQVGVNQKHPDTDGTIIAYASFASPTSNAQIAWQPVAGGTEQVLNLPGSAINPTVSGGLIAFDYDPILSGSHNNLCI